MARTKLIDLYKSLHDTPLHEQMSPETLMVKLGGDEKTELKITNQTDTNGDVDLSNVTLEFKGEKYEGLEFKLEEILEDHDNEGKDALFVAESDDKKFEVEVNIEADYDQSGRIQDVEWRSLETFPKEMNEKAKSGKRPDYADVDGDGDEEESMEKAFKDKENKTEIKKKKRKDIHRDIPKPGNPASSIIDEIIDETYCTEQEIAEGTCGYGEDGDLGDEPAGPHLFMLEDEESVEEGLKGGDVLPGICTCGCEDGSSCVEMELPDGTCECICCEEDVPVKDKYSKKLEESVIKRLQKLANIKNETK